MNKAEQIQLVHDAFWGHEDGKDRLLSDGDRTVLCNRIGAGEKEVCRVGSRGGRLLVHVQRVS